MLKLINSSLFLLSLSLMQIFVRTDTSFDEKLSRFAEISWDMSLYVSKELDFEYYTGFVPVGKKYFQVNTSLFFSMMTKVGETLKTMDSSTPVIFWFGGGPGQSSQYGSFNEIGPIFCDENLKGYLREFSWNKQAALVFVDQPLHTGFSYSQYDYISVTNTKEATQFFKIFLQGFYKKVPEFLGKPTYFFGEGFAGHFVPSFAEMVIKEKPVQGMNFQGIGLGSALVNIGKQMATYSDYVFNMGIASQKTRENVEDQQIKALSDLEQKKLDEATLIFNELTQNMTAYGNVDPFNLNYYKNQEGQQNNPAIPFYQDQLHNTVFLMMFGNIFPKFLPNFQNFNQTIYNNFQEDLSLSFQPQLEYLLNQGVKVMLFNGQLDLIANSAAANDFVYSLNWNYSFKWKNQQKVVWFERDSTTAVNGNYQIFNNLVQVNVYNAGHMIAVDQPQVAYQMLEKFLKWDW